MSDSIWLSIQKAAELYDVSRRTIERHLAKGSISDTQTRTVGNERQIAFAELRAVLGEPKRYAAQTREDASTPPASDPMFHQSDDTLRRLIDRLENDLERERQRGDKERERADRYEVELAEVRQKNEALITRLLPPADDPPKKGFFGRLF